MIVYLLSENLRVDGISFSSSFIEDAWSVYSESCSYQHRGYYTTAEYYQTLIKLWDSLVLE